MRRHKHLILLMALLPWLTVPLLGAKALKRYIPSALFITLFLIIEGWIAEKKKWWWFFHKANPNVLGELPLIIGPFFIGSIWTLKYTFGDFKRYFITNIIIDSLFTYVLMGIFKKIGYVSLVRLSKIQLSLVFIIKSLLLYGFQYGYEFLKKRRKLDEF